MAVSIIDSLEVVEIQKEQRARAIGALGAFELLIDGCNERTMIRQPGERIGGGQ